MEEFNIIWNQQLGQLLKTTILILNLPFPFAATFWDKQKYFNSKNRATFLLVIVKTHSIEFLFKFLQVVYVFGTQSFSTI